MEKTTESMQLEGWKLPQDEWTTMVWRCVTAAAAAAVRSHITVAQVVRSGRRLRLSCPIYASSSPEDLSVVYASRRRPSVYELRNPCAAHLHLLERRRRRRPTKARSRRTIRRDERETFSKDTKVQKERGEKRRLVHFNSI